MVVPKWRKLFDAHKHLPPLTLFRLGIPDTHGYYDDLLQDAQYAFVKACQWYARRVSKRYTNPAQFTTIAIKFIRRHVNRQYEHYQRSGMRQVAIPDTPVDFIAELDKAEEVGEGVRRVIAAMECLSEEEQHYICAYFLCGVSQSGIAKIIDKPASTIQRHLSNGIEKLQNNLTTLVDK